MKFIHLLLFLFCFGSIYGQSFSDSYCKDCKINGHDGKYGITFQGQQAIPCEYDAIKKLSNSCYLTQKGSKSGLVKVMFFKTNYRVNKNDNTQTFRVKKGYINISEVLPCEYDIVEDTGSGSLRLMKGKKTGIANHYGNIIVRCEYDQVELRNNNYYVTQGDRQGVFNRYGNTIIPCKFTAIEFQNNNYYVSSGKLKGVYNYYGNTIIPARYTAIQRKGNNYLVENGKLKGIFNYYGNTILPCRFEEITKIDNHYHVMQEGKYGVYNSYGNTIVPCRYEEVTPLRNRYVVKNGDLYGVINQYGNTILPCRFEKIELLSNGNYMATQNDTRQLYNAYGNLLSDYSGNNVIYSTDNAVE